MTVVQVTFLIMFEVQPASLNWFVHLPLSALFRLQLLPSAQDAFAFLPEQSLRYYHGYVVSLILKQFIFNTVHVYSHNVRGYSLRALNMVFFLQ